MKFLPCKLNTLVCGIDEVGRGAFFGPLVACALYCHTKADNVFANLRDSKHLSITSRNNFYSLISRYCTYAIGFASNSEIDALNIKNANILAVKRAVRCLSKTFFKCFVDGNMSFADSSYVSIVRGDEKYIEIASASIIAKVTRDHLISIYNHYYPQYQLYQSKGYGTKYHIQAIKQFGITNMHRKSFLSKIISEV